jgi:hypothetical protein
MPLAHQPPTSLFPRLRATIARLSALVLIVANPYRPELHYMRGPGPKWHAKQRAMVRV